MNPILDLERIILMNEKIARIVLAVLVGITVAGGMELYPVITAKASTVPVEAPVIKTETAPVITSSDDNSWMVDYLVEKAKSESNDPFEGLSNEETKCAITALLDEFSIGDLAAVSSGSPEMLSRSVRLEETWKNVCGIEPSVIGAFSA